MTSAGFKVIGVDSDSNKIESLKSKSLTGFPQNLSTNFPDNDLTLSTHKGNLVFIIF